MIIMAEAEKPQLEKAIAQAPPQVQAIFKAIDRATAATLKGKMRFGDRDLVRNALQSKREEIFSIVQKFLKDPNSTIIFDLFGKLKLTENQKLELADKFANELRAQFSNNKETRGINTPSGHTEYTPNTYNKAGSIVFLSRNYSQHSD